MKSSLRLLSLSLALLLPLSAAHAQVSVSPISNQIVNAGGGIVVNVSAVDTLGRAITLTASIPAFAVLNPPTTGTGSVATTLTVNPGDGDVGVFTASITATAGEQSDTEEFQITVNAAGTDLPPRVFAPALRTVDEGQLLEIDVTTRDDQPITSLTALNLPTGASFATSDPFATGTLTWTPGFDQAGEYDVIFVASNALSDSSTTHISVHGATPPGTPVALAPIADVTLAEMDTVNVDVLATDPDKEAITLTSSLPAFATLNPPTSSTDAESLATTIQIAPGPGTAGIYQAWVTATSGTDAATDSFMITVTAPTGGGGGLAATASMIGAFNTHKKKICFKVVPVENSFDLRDVSLSTITLNFNGISIPAIHPTHLALDCDDEDEDEGEGDGGPGVEHHHGDDDAAAMLAASHDGPEDGDGDDEDDCDECESDSTDCEGSHIMACFSMSDIRGLFEGVPTPHALSEATIEGQLGDGQTFVATMDGRVHVPPGQGNGDGDSDKGKGKMHLFVRPNPMNPKADIVFTLSQAGAVRVSIYDLRGRLVRTIQDGNLTAGQHSIPWEGSTVSGNRAASGIYFVKVATASETEVLPVTVLK